MITKQKNNTLNKFIRVLLYYTTLERKLPNNTTITFKECLDQ